MHMRTSRSRRAATAAVAHTHPSAHLQHGGAARCACLLLGGAIRHHARTRPRARAIECAAARHRQWSVVRWCVVRFTHLRGGGGGWLVRLPCPCPCPCGPSPPPRRRRRAPPSVTLYLLLGHAPLPAGCKSLTPLAAIAHALPSLADSSAGDDEVHALRHLRRRYATHRAGLLQNLTPQQARVHCVSSAILQNTKATVHHEARSRWLSRLDGFTPATCALSGCRVVQVQTLLAPARRRSALFCAILQNSARKKPRRAARWLRLTVPSIDDDVDGLERQYSSALHYALIMDGPDATANVSEPGPNPN